MRSGEINRPGDKVRDDLSVYANHSESFEPTSPWVNLLNAAEPQRGTQYEAGIISLGHTEADIVRTGEVVAKALAAI